MSTQPFHFVMDLAKVFAFRSAPLPRQHSGVSLVSSRCSECHGACVGYTACCGSPNKFDQNCNGISLRVIMWRVIDSNSCKWLSGISINENRSQIQSRSCYSQGWLVHCMIRFKRH